MILILDMNNLTGTLPKEIAGLTSLSELHVYTNNLGGTLPTELGLLSSLSLLDLEVNRFEGKLFFDELLNTNQTLQRLRGSDNWFVGSIPSWIGVLKGLKEFWAADNNLIGTIPDTIAYLTDLGTLYLEIACYGNVEITKLNNLDRFKESWYLYGNKLNGTIPSNIGSLINLQEMDLHGNDFHGSIPSSVGSMGKLMRLVLSESHLTGSIPPSLANVASLMDVFLDTNQLTGSVPVGFGSLLNLSKFLTLLIYLTESYFSSFFFGLS